MNEAATTFSIDQVEELERILCYKVSETNRRLDEYARTLANYIKDPVSYVNEK